MDAGSMAVPGGEGGLDRDGADFYEHSRQTFWKVLSESSSFSPLLRN